MIKALKGGCEARHPAGYQMMRPKGLPHFVLLIVHTHGEFQIDGTHFSVSPPQLLLLAPDTPYSYENPQGNYTDDWLHFEMEASPLARQLAAISNRPFPIGDLKLLSFCIRQILWELSYGDPDFAEKNIDALFTLLLHHILQAHRERNSISARNPVRARLQQLRLEMKASVHESYHVPELARRLNISESYFQYLYKELFGISFRQDLIRMRVEHAKYLIATSDLPLEQVAEICGYGNEVHFYRQFKKMTGTTPARYRRKEASYESDDPV